ncbi:ankyrin repeat domain-containing protein 49 isoform X1 [Bombyx mori]|uniref:Ankyrin repeat domain-containing protein 49 n=1 Tax=Bombyx mori TaxID=7091 RepID=A0A8R2QWQ6_BOMMO|nr:ankyrin repeat domain-containing protein 49 isoform X1 [Bombyx mori]
MSDEDDSDVEAKYFKEISDEIQTLKKNPETSGMFVSGWDDADQDVDLVKDPKANPIDHVLWAAEHNKLDTLRELLVAKPGLVHSRDSDGYTPLHRAAYSNHLDAISLLLSFGAKVSSKSELGWTPLHSACNWNNYHIVARLLAAGADPAAPSEGDINMNHTRTLANLEKKKDLHQVQTPLHLASHLSHCKSTLLLLLLREDLVEVARKPNNSGETPEQLARGHGIYAPLFEMVSPASSYVSSLAFTCNRYLQTNK